VNSTNITLYYNLSSSNIANCSLMLNGILNSTQNSSQIQFQNNDGKNNFTLLNMSYGVYNWTVLCFDINNFNGTDTVRMFQLDNIAPNISLIFPGNGNVVFSRNINFTFNVTDIDNILVCNLTIDGILNSTNFNATSSAITGVYVPKMSVTNHTWNVTCIDNTGFSSISSTWNFTINSNVSVSLVNPPNGNLTNSSGPSLSYIPSSPADFDLGFCDLYIDSSVYSTHVALTSGSQDTFGTSNLANGIHFWFVNCTDDVGKVGLSVTWNFTIDRTPPVVTIYYPNGTLLNVSSVFFNWTAIDNIAPNMTCNVRVNGTVQSPGNIFSINNSVTNSTYSGFTDGLSVWNVTCTDTVGNSNTSTTLNFTVEEPPSVGLGNPPNNNRTRNGNITFFYTPKDNSGSIGNCTFILDGSANFTNKTITNNVQNNFTLYNISEGAHNWTVNCTDLSGNTGTNLSVKNFTIDLTAPNVSLIYPPEGSFLSGAINFNWTATDYAGVQISCGLFLDGNYTNKTVSKVSGSSFNTTLTNISSGPHNWSVNCSDDLNNYVMSGVGNFTVNQPDLYIDSSRIQFNNTNPDENQTINITANVTNIGGVDVGNVFVNFYDGDPSLGLIIGNSTGSVVVNGSRIFSAIWNITTGYHTIFVSVDPYNAVSEINENNNNATLNISILRSIVAAPQNNSAFVNPNITVNFTLQDFSGGNINYSVIVDGALNGQNGSVVDGVLTLINVSINQGLHYIVIQGTDALGRSKNSSRVYVTVDYTPPATVINTINNTWFNYSTPQINISATDNVYTNISYIIYVNGTANINGTILSGTSALVNLTSLANGYYQIQMQAWDFLNNTNTTIKFINVDTAIPSITLNSPNDGTNFTVRTVTLNYTVNDNLAATANCSITLDGLNVKNSTVNISQVNTFVLNNLAEGTHYWNVTCTDLAKNLNYSSTRSFNVYIAPNITIISPPDNYWSNALSNTFYFNVSDETGLTNCSILINGTISQTKNTSQLINNAQNNFTVVFVNSGNYTWAIECYDNTTFRAYNISLNRTLLVDVIKPQPSIITLGGSWFSNATPQISFNITDNMANTLNYTFYVNNTANVNGSVNNNTVSSASLQGLTNGTYTIVLEATDIAGNKQNSSIISITIDTVKPSINLTTPLNATNISVNYADLNFTPRDNLASYLICNLTLDGVITASNLNVSNSQKQNVSIQSLKGGNHYWNVTCFDQAGNINTSQTFSFYVQMPDLYINNSLIFFSNNNPIENDTINITAELHNVGNVDAFNFTTQIWANSPSTGILILNITLNLSSNHSINITTNYTMPIGDTPFYVLLDTPLASNGSVMEGNESNNNASASIHVGLWEYVMGNISANLALINNQSIYSWFINNASGGKIYAADADSNVHWFTLQALGRNVSNQSSSADFYTLDTKINSTILTDSVNRTYTQANLPIDTQNFTLFNRRVLNVPVVNSTNTSNFKTGILWDYGDGGLVYNGSQNIVFVSTINTSIQGYNSTEDYEIRVPATLRSYKGSVNQVVFYGELI